MVAQAVELQGHELERIIDLVRMHTGINMDAGKRKLLDGRLNRRLRELGITSFNEYCDEISRPGSDELQLFINAVTTNLTSFFREPHHFQYLAENALPQLLEHNANHKLRIWSAGCSSGPEPYSIAMTVAEALPAGLNCDWKILATDLDSSVLAHGASGVYENAQTEGVSDVLRKRYFDKGIDHNQGKLRVRAALRSRVVFKQLNLMGPWPMHGPFDIVFCRNVSIYFDKRTQVRLFDRFASLMAPGSLLFIGHSESLHKISKRFRLIGKTTYERLA